MISECKAAGGSLNRDVTFRQPRAKSVVVVSNYLRGRLVTRLGGSGGSFDWFVHRSIIFACQMV